MGRRIASESKQTVRGGPKPALKVGLHRRLKSSVHAFDFRDVAERNARKRRTSTKRFLACKAGARGLGKSRKLFSNMAEFQNI